MHLIPEGKRDLDLKSKASIGAGVRSPLGLFQGAKSAGLRSFALSADWDPETAPANVAVDFYIRAL
jgi:hypothetical protein